MKNKISFSIGLVVFLMFFVQVNAASDAIKTTSGIVIDPGIHVLASEFNGVTTDFLRKNDSILGRLGNMTLEVSVYGKIVFDNLINLTQVHDNYVVDLDSHVEISSNLFSIETNYFTNLKKPATITIRGLLFTNPMILQDGVDCGENCTFVSYYNGIFVFKVANFSSTYSAKEIPTEAPISTTPVVSTGGGSVSSSTTTTSAGTEDKVAGKKEVDFEISQNVFDIKLKQGDGIEKKINIRNTGSRDLLFTIDVNGSMDNFLISDNVFSIRAGSSKDVTIYFYSRTNESSSVKTGRILINTISLQKTISYVIELSEKKPLFDVSSKLVSSKVKVKGTILADISMTNMGDLDKVDVILEYIIKDMTNNEIKIEEETLAVTDSLKIRRSFKVPEDLSTGDYVFIAKLTYDNRTASSANRFVLYDRVVYTSKIPSINWIIIIVLLIIIAIILGVRHKKRHPFI